MRYLGGPNKAYELPDDELEALVAVIRLREKNEWSWYTHTPATMRDIVELNNASAKAKRKPGEGTGDEGLDAFNEFAAGNTP